MSQILTKEELRRRIKELTRNQSSEKPKFDPRFCERAEGATPLGGAYSIAYYYNENGPCRKDEAKRVNIVIYDENDRRINEVYGSFEE